MKFKHVAEIFNEIEQVSSRITITKLLADLFKKSTPSEASVISYLSLGELNPVYVGTKFNFAEKSMQKVIASLLKVGDATVARHRKKEGDFGLVVENSGWKPKKDKGLTVSQVEKELQAFLKISGGGAQGAKEKKLLSILSGLDPLSAKYVVRVVLGKLRLGFSDMTLIDAFSWMEAGDKSLRAPLENAYNISADIGLIIKVLKDHGIKAIEKMKITPGVPIRPAAAERLESAAAIIKKIGTCVAQPKLDGFRLQVHVFSKRGKKQIRFFSRNLQDMSEMFPELSTQAKKLGSKDFVAEGEAIAYDVETGTFLPFQETVKRRRKYDIEAMAKDVPLKLYLFDLLYLSGKSLLDLTHEQRRKKMLSLFKGKKTDIIAPLEEEKIKTAKGLEKYFDQNIASGLEGLVIKKPDSIYQPGKRNFNWIKLKRQETGHLDDTIDCVILGYYVGHGKRASFGIGALLVGVYNTKNDRFETIAKIGTGLSDKEWKQQKKDCDKISVKNKPKNVVCAKELVPDVWVSPEIVALIRADEITLSPLHSAGATKSHHGYALRFPRLMGYREDKSPREATTVKEIKELYDIQFKGKARKKKKKKAKRVKGQRSIF
jgi:DNA ligase-1